MALGLVTVAAVAGLAYYWTVLEAGPVRVSGVVSANQVLVSAQIDGRLEQLLVEEGTSVEEGELVARLVPTELEAERQRQLASLDQLQAKLTQSQELVQLERERARSRRAGAEAQLRLAKSQLEEAQAEYLQREKDLESGLRLTEQGLSPKQEHDKLVTQVRVAEARVRSAGDQVVAAQAEVELARANERQVQVTMLDEQQTLAQMEQARAELTQIEARLGYTEIRAPLGGVVSVRVASQGEVVRAGDPIVTIVDLDDVWVRAEVEEGWSGRIAVGQPLEIELATGERLSGEVTFVSPEASFATQRDVGRTQRDIRTFGIKVAVPNPRRQVHPGMTAYVFLPS